MRSVYDINIYMSIYWILKFVPTIAIHLALLAGLLGLFIAAFIQKIPFVNQYKFPIQLVSIILALSSVYFEGALGYKESTALAVAKLEQKLAEAEAKGAKVNTVLVEKLVKDTQVIREKGKTITEYVDREVTKYDNTCVIPNEVIKAHNAAATLDTTTLDGEKK